MVSLKRGWCSTARNHGWLWSQMQMRIECRWGQPHVQFKSAMSSRQARTRGTGHVKITYRRGLAAQMTDGRVTSGNGRYVVVVQRSPSPPNDVENFHQRIIDKRQAAAPYSVLGSNATYLHDAKARSSHTALCDGICGMASHCFCLFLTCMRTILLPYLAPGQLIDTGR